MKPFKFALVSGALAVAAAIYALPSKAQVSDDWDFLGVKAIGGGGVGGYSIQKYNSIDGSIETVSNKNFGSNIWGLSGTAQFSSVDQKMYFGTAGGTHYYDLENNKWGKSNTLKVGSNTTGMGAQYVPRQLAIGESNCTSVGIGDGKITICPPTTSKPKGVYVDNNPLIGKMTTGEIHIGENSLITIEENGRQKLYAKDANGNAIPIDITEGSDLLINGKSLKGALDSLTPNVSADGVSALRTMAEKFDDLTPNIPGDGVLGAATAIRRNQSNINNLGSGVAGATALTAALSSLPVASDDAPFSCGVGSGGYSSRFAMGVGCAARFNERLSVNLGGSHVFGGSTDYGDDSLDTVAVRGGFVFKLGSVDKPVTSNEQLQSQLDEVKQENASIKAKYSTIEEQNKALMARLERLEAIALGVKPALTTASLK